MSNVATVRPVKKRKMVRVNKSSTALKMLKDVGFGKGLEMSAFTIGQFSKIDLIEAVLKYTGPVEMHIATWSAAGADMRRVEEFIESGMATKVTFLIDHSFRKRQPKLLKVLDGIGADVYEAACHAKIVLLKNDDWNVVIKTSMNLNKNPRIESFDITECQEYYQHHKDMLNMLVELAKESGEVRSRRALRLL